jgi:hypothetical protein
MMREDKYYIRISRDLLNVSNSVTSTGNFFFNTPKIGSKSKSGIEVTNLTLFERKTEYRAGEDDYITLSLNTKNFDRARGELEDEFVMELPKFSDGSTETLTLKRYQFLNKNFKVAVTSDKGYSEIDYVPDVKSYRVYIDGEERGYMVITEDEIKTTYASDDVQVELTKLTNGDYILFDANELNKNVVFNCGGSNYEIDPKDLIYTEKKSAISGNCCLVAVDIDYYTYLKFNNVNQAVNWASTIFAVVSQIYDVELDGIVNIQVPYIHVWTSLDPYSSVSDPLSTFQNYWENSNNFSQVQRNVTSLLTARTDPPYGGVAWMNGGCNFPLTVCSTDYAYNVNCNLATSQTTYSPPSYSWNVKVVSHELGHNFGSPHTHSCCWTNGAIDGCSGSEGGCPNGPYPPTSGKGTIMSYCHTQPVGSLLHFHPQVKSEALIPSFASGQCYGGCVEDPYVDSGGGENVNDNGSIYYNVNLSTGKETEEEACQSPPINGYYSDSVYYALGLGDIIYTDIDFTVPLTASEDLWYNLSVTNKTIKISKDNGEIIQVASCVIDNGGGGGGNVYQIFLSKGFENQGGACGGQLQDLYYSSKNYSSFVIGDRIFIDVNLTTPLTSDNNYWYRFGDSGYVIQVNGETGEVMDIIECDNNGGGGGNGNTKDIEVPIMLTQSYDDMGFYTPFDGYIVQKDVVNNFIITGTTDSPYDVSLYNSSEQFKKFIDIANYTIEWGDNSVDEVISSPNDVFNHTYPNENNTYTIRLTQRNIWGVTTVEKKIKIPIEDVVLDFQSTTVTFNSNQGNWSGVTLTYGELNMDGDNSISGQTSDNFTSIPFTISGYTNSKINELSLYGVNKFVELVPVKKYGEDYGMINEITEIYTAYTVNNIEYYDYPDGTTLFFVSSSGLTEDMITSEPITKEDILMGVVNSPEIQSAIFIERGKNSAFESLQRLGEVDNIGDLTSYGYGFFKINKT